MIVPSLADGVLDTLDRCQNGLPRFRRASEERVRLAGRVKTAAPSTKNSFEGWKN